MLFLTCENCNSHWGIEKADIHDNNKIICQNCDCEFSLSQEQCDVLLNKYMQV